MIRHRSQTDNKALLKGQIRNAMHDNLKLQPVSEESEIVDHHNITGIGIFWSKKSAYVLNFLSIGGFSLVLVTTKLSYDYNKLINGFDCMLVKSISMSGFTFTFMIINRTNVYKPILGISKNLGACLFVTGLFMYIYAYSLMNLSENRTSIDYNANPIFVGLFAAVILKEKLSRTELIGVIGAFAGVIVISLPTGRELPSNTQIVALVRALL